MMNKMILFCCTTLISTTANAALNLKPGLWRVQSKVTRDGVEFDPQAMMKQAMAKMSPEQKKQMESMMAKMGKGGPAVSMGDEGLEVCYTSELLKNDALFTQQQSGECSHEFPVKSASRMVIKFKCKNGVEGEGEWNLKDSTHYSGTMKINEKSGKKSEIKYQAQFASPNCGNVKAIDPALLNK